jgi:hypothetical protein
VEEILNVRSCSEDGSSKVAKGLWWLRCRGRAGC